MNPKPNKNALINAIIQTTPELTRKSHQLNKNERGNGTDEDRLLRPQIVSKSALNRLSRATIPELVLDRQNAGKCVLVRILEEGYSREEGSWFSVVEDQLGLVMGLALYNYPKDELFVPGTVLFIKEPYCKFKMCFKFDMRVPFFRCDCPTDILVLTLSHDLRPIADRTAWKNPINYKNPLTKHPLPRSSEEWKKLGKKLVNENRMLLAREAYFKAQQMCRQNDPISEQILQNLLQVQLSLGYYDWVVEHAKKLPKEEKVLFRMGKAYYMLRQYENAASTFRDLTEKFKDSKLFKNELKRAEGRVKETKSGFDVYKIPQLMLNNPGQEIDCADFCEKVKVEAVEGKGRGLILQTRVEKGNVVLVAKAIVATLNPDEFYDEQASNNATDTQNAGLNQSGSQIIKMNFGLASNPSNAESNDPKSKLKVMGAEPNDAKLIYDVHRSRMVSRLTALVYKNPESFGSLIFDLYSGKSFREPVQWFCNSEAKSERICNVDRINDICINNLYYQTDADSMRKDICVIFHMPSFLNHSCIPNVDCEFYNDVIVVKALVDIPAGTELTISYVDNQTEYQERTKHLKALNIVCTCSKCKQSI